jgi:hypothetical protein
MTKALGFVLSLPLIFALIFTGCLPQPTQPKPESTTPSPTPASVKPIEALTADWQKYTNSRYHYLIKYPPDWFFHQAGYSPPPPTVVLFASVPEGQTQSAYASFEVFVDQAAGRNLENYGEIVHLQEDHLKDSLTIDNAPAVILTPTGKSLGLIAVYALHHDFIYRLGWQATDLETAQKYQEVFKQILATFEFTD